MPHLANVLRQIQQSARRGLSLRARFRSIRTGRSLYTRIGAGYLDAIAIAITGSLLGLVGADYYQGRGIEQLFDAQKQVKLLDDLQFASAAVKFQGLRLTLENGYSPAQAQNVIEFERIYEQAIVSTDAMLAFVETNPVWLAAEPEQVVALMDAYAAAILDYHTELKAFFAQGALPMPSSEREALQDQFSLIQRGDRLLELEFLFREVEQLRRRASTQVVSSSEQMEVIQGYEKLAIVLSLITSAAIAAVIAWRTTRRIAAPIANAASLAQRVASNDDYSLRLPITTDDEVGRLIGSLNYLIARVELRSQQLETAANSARTKAQALEQTLADLEATQMQLIQSEKMSSLGQLVAGIAHEINNPTSFVYGNISHAREYVDDLLRLLDGYRQRYPDDDVLNDLSEELDLEFIVGDIHSMMNSMETGAQRIRDIVRSLRVFSRLDESEVKAVDLHDGIDSTLTILNTRFRMFPYSRPIELEKDYGQLPLVECHGTQINQVVMNLIVNAIDALEDAAAAGKWDAAEGGDASGQTPRLTIRSRDRGDDWVTIEVADNALGIPETAREKLFDPFFTTKAIGRGTGLGLSICYKIITETHHGQLEYQTEIGQGTTFRIQLPKVLTPPVDRTSKNDVEKGAGNHSRNHARNHAGNHSGDRLSNASGHSTTHRAPNRAGASVQTLEVAVSLGRSYRSA